MNWQNLSIQCAWAGTLLLLAAFGAGWALRAAPAAWRHFLWTAALSGLVILPLAVRTLPKWTIERTIASAPAAIGVVASAATVEAGTPAAPAVRRENPWAVFWLAGVALTALRFAAGRLRMRGIVRRATEARYARALLASMGGEGTGVRQSGEAGTAFAAGIFHPVIVLPVGADVWPAERLRAALLHEWMHVRRRDLLAQAIGQAACCVYWFHPLAWMAARQLRREREQACDDAVLGRGIAAREYAGHLVESVRALRGRRADVMAMAEPSELELRVRALLDGGRDRRPLNRAAAGATIAALAVVLLPAVAVTVHAQPQAARKFAMAGPREPAAAPAASEPAPQPGPPEEAEASAPAPQQPGWGTLKGVVQDPSGARIVNCRVTIAWNDGSNAQNTTTDLLGTYEFGSIPAGAYTVQVTAPGFKLMTRKSLMVQDGQTMTANWSLEVGNVREALTVTAPRPASAAPAAAAAPTSSNRVRVGGMVQPAVLVARVAPVYPEDLKAQGVSGVVQLEAIIDKHGNLVEIRALGGPSGLTKPAMDAVSQWHYQPALLNGEPIAVQTIIDISFELQ